MSDDLIRRQDAVSRMSDLICKLKSERSPTWDEVYNAMSDLPSIHPEQKTGRWIYMSDCEDWFCSNCKDIFMLLEGTPKDNDYNYCPNCGVEMESEE